jgi:hypothetical protein
LTSVLSRIVITKKGVPIKRTDPYADQRRRAKKAVWARCPDLHQGPSST